MKKLIYAFLLVMALMITGCSNTEPQQEIKAQAEPTKPVKSIQSQVKNIPDSVTEYQGEINGKNLKTGILKISTRNGNSLILDMEVQFSGELRNLMNSTKNKFGFTFLEVTGKHRLDEIVTDWGTPIDGHVVMQNLPETGGVFQIHQELRLKENPMPEELKYATSAATYMFATINENKEVVAATIGLDAGTIQK